MLKKENRLYLKIIIILCLISSAGVGITSNSVGVFYSYVSSDLNILNGTYVLHNTISMITMGVVALFVPKWINSKNFRKCITIATIVSSLAIYLMSFQSNIYMFYLLGFIRGCGVAFYAFVSISMIINHWFNKDRGFITSIVYAFAGVAGAIFSPLFLHIIQNYGWRYGYKAMAILMFACMVPFMLSKFTFFPSEMKKLPYGELKLEKKEVCNKEIDKLLFVYIALFASLIHFASSNMQHLSAIAISRNFSTSTISLIVSLSMIGNVFFKFVSGKVSDTKSSTYSNILMLSICFVGGILLLLSNNEILFLLGGLLFGSVFAETAVGLTVITTDFFGIENYDQVYPIYSLLGNGFYALACSVMGYLYDFTKSYNMGLLISIILILICMFLIMLGYKRVQKKEHF